MDWTSFGSPTNPASQGDTRPGPATSAHRRQDHAADVPVAQPQARASLAQTNSVITALKTAILQSPRARQLVQITCDAITAPTTKKGKHDSALEHICRGKLQDLLEEGTYDHTPDTDLWVAACKAAFVDPSFVDHKTMLQAPISLPLMQQPHVVMRPRDPFETMPRPHGQPHSAPGASITGRQGSTHETDSVPIGDSRNDPRPGSTRRRTQTPSEESAGTARRGMAEPHDTQTRAMTKMPKRAAIAKGPRSRITKPRVSQPGSSTKGKKPPEDAFRQWSDDHKQFFIETMLEVAREGAGGWAAVTQRLKDKGVPEKLIVVRSKDTYAKLRACGHECVNDPKCDKISQTVYDTITRLTKSVANSARKIKPREEAHRTTVTRWSEEQIGHFIKEMKDMAVGNQKGGWETIQKRLKDVWKVPHDYLYQGGRGHIFFLVKQLAKALVERGTIEQKLLDDVEKIDKLYRGRLRASRAREKKAQKLHDTPSQQESSNEDMSDDQSEPASPIRRPEVPARSRSQSRGRERTGTEPPRRIGWASPVRSATGAFRHFS